jgi:hypothetical protein
MDYIKYVVVYDGEKECQNEEVVNHPEYRKYYGTANVLYKFFIDDINASDTAYLYIDATDRPTFQIKDAPTELLDKLRAANLG